MPTRPVRLGLKVMTGGAVPGAAIDLFVEFVPKPKDASNESFWAIPAHGFVAKNDHVGPCVPPRVGYTCVAHVWNMSAPLKLKDGDKSIDIVAWVDHTVIEVFFMGGRGHWTVPLTCSALTNNTEAGISIYASGSSVMLFEEAASWSVGSIWTRDADCGDNCS